MEPKPKTAGGERGPKSRDGQTIVAASEVLSGQSKARGLARLWPFLGPAFIASVAYVDPGNFATNIQGGAKYGYTLLWVIVLSNLMGMLIQSLSAKLGIASGRNLAELCRIHFPCSLVWVMWVLMELVAIATDLAEFLGAAIVDHQRELSPELIVICTHGRTGLRDLLFGSIAQQVVAAGRTPVLLIRPHPGAQPSPFTCRTLFAPTDAGPVHEQGLRVALNLARALSAHLHLLCVVPTMGTLAGRDATTGRYMPGAMHAMLELAEEEKHDYLRHQGEKMAKQGVSVSQEVRRGDPASIIAETASTFDTPIIVLATHGTLGADALLTDAVAAKVLARTRLPLLLAPVKEETLA